MQVGLYSCGPKCWGGGTPYNGLYGEAPPERGTFFKLQLYKRVGIHKLTYIKGWRNRSFSYFKGPFIIIFQVDVTYGCVSLFIKDYMKMRTRLPKVDM